MKVQFILMWQIWVCFQYYFCCLLLLFVVKALRDEVGDGNWSSEDIGWEPSGLRSCCGALLTSSHRFQEDPLLFVYLWKDCTKMLFGWPVLLKFTITPIAFSIAQGHGAKGDNVYEFHLEFFDLVKPEVCSFLSLEGGPQDLGQVTQIPPVPPSQGLRNPAPTA